MATSGSEESNAARARRRCIVAASSLHDSHCIVGRTDSSVCHCRCGGSSITPSLHFGGMQTERNAVVVQVLPESLNAACCLRRQ
jgi:hypothetical protein